MSNFASLSVDTTGAGDLFATGFLFGLVHNAGYENAGRLGALAAANVAEGAGEATRAAGVALSE